MADVADRTFLIVAGPDVSRCARGLNHLGWDGWGTHDPKLAHVLIDERAYDLALIEARYAEVVHLARAKDPGLPVILLIDSDDDARSGLARLGNERVDAVVRWQDPPEVVTETAQQIVRT
jgi:hypothetical protein